MEPRIQYAKTKDGVSIAFWTLGEGMPLVYVPDIPFSHIQMGWQITAWRTWDERLAENRKLIRYDSRGSGLSGRSVGDYSLDALVLDLEAVVDRQDLERFALFGTYHGGPVATAYAARHPERVSHLILCSTYTRSSEYLASAPQVQAERKLMEQDWQTYTETRAHVGFGWSAGQQAHQYAELMRESVALEMALAAYRAIEEFDTKDLLPQVRSPTLILHRRQFPLIGVDIARGLAARIPDARLALLEGTSGIPFLGDSEAVLSAIDEFLDEGEEAKKDETTEPGAFRTVLFTDVEGSTALTQRLGDAQARDLLREHERMVREALKAHGGSEVKTMGDGFMASFTSATKALQCAIAMQRAFAEWNAGRGGSRTAPAPEPIRVRVGLNAGEPIAEDDPDGRSDLFGTAVNLAARICAHAEAGQILVPIVIRELTAGKQFLFADLGETELRGYEDAVRLYEVSWRETR